MSAAEVKRVEQTGLGDERVADWRAEFPILRTRVHGKRLAYLDNGATTQKPRVVIDALRRYYETENSNVHRGVHYLSEQATERYEGARDLVREFVGARSRQEIVFTRGTTEAINLVASSFGQYSVRQGDEILITELEHHSNIVPWQMLCERTGARLRVAPVNDAGEVELDGFKALLTDRTRLAAFSHISNALGSINPVREMTAAAQGAGAKVLIDGAQAVAHTLIDVQQIGCDFYAFSGHKVFGPTGIGALYGREQLLDAMPPYQGGGDMIRTVTFERTVYNDLPYKFEAGTPAIADAIGLGEAVRFVNGVGLDDIGRHEKALLEHTLDRLRGIQGIRLIGMARARAGIVSFVLDEVHAHDLGTILDSQGVAIRVGHHCAMPLMARFNTPATARVSFALYNDMADIDQFFNALDQAREFFLA